MGEGIDAVESLAHPDQIEMRVPDGDRGCAVRGMAHRKAIARFLQVIADSAEERELVVGRAQILLVRAGEMSPKALDAQAHCIRHRPGQRERLGRLNAESVQTGVYFEMDGNFLAHPL